MLGFFETQDRMSVFGQALAKRKKKEKKDK